MERDFIVAAAGAFVGVLGSELIRWILRKAETSGRGILRWLFNQLKRPFGWVVLEVREWRRVSGYRHREITWDDLLQDARDSVDFHDLSVRARGSVQMKDTPQSLKYDLLHTFVLPEIDGVSHAGKLHRLDSSGHPELSRDVQVAFSWNHPSFYVGQDGMRLDLEIGFSSIQEEIPCQPNARIMLDLGTIALIGDVKRHNQLRPGSQWVEVWISYFLYKAMLIFSDQRL